MKKLIVLAGIVASGKSTYAQKLSKELNAPIISTDKIRGELCNGDESDQSKNDFMFEHVIPLRFKQAFEKNDIVIYDATNVRLFVRKSTLDYVPDGGVAELHWIAPNLERSLKWNAARDRKVPEKYIHQQFKAWNNPGEAEYKLFSKIKEIVINS